jgi:hypothetical protein
MEVQGTLRCPSCDQGNRPDRRFCKCEGHLALARVLLATEGATARNEVEHALSEALRLVDDTGARSYAPAIWIQRAELAHLTGYEAVGEHALREAQRLFTEMGATARAEAVARQLKNVSATTS